MKSASSRVTSVQEANATRALPESSRVARAPERGGVPALLTIQRMYGNRFVQRMLTSDDGSFGRGELSSANPAGRKSLTHELAHVVRHNSVARTGDVLRMCADCEDEQKQTGVGRMVQLRLKVGAVGAASRGSIQRACLPAADCAAPIPGSSTEFGVQEENVEASARARRARMSPAR